MWLMLLIPLVPCGNVDRVTAGVVVDGEHEHDDDGDGDAGGDGDDGDGRFC